MRRYQEEDCALAPAIAGQLAHAGVAGACVLSPDEDAAEGFADEAPFAWLLSAPRKSVAYQPEPFN
jgi:hypothetical protein